MTLNELIEKAKELQAQGYGEAKVAYEYDCEFLYAADINVTQSGKHESFDGKIIPSEEIILIS